MKSEAEVRDEMADLHQAGIAPQYGGEIGLIAYHKFIAGWSASLRHSPTVLKMKAALEYCDATGAREALKAYDEEVRGE